MEFRFTTSFQKSFSKKQKRIQEQALDRIEIFKTNPKHPLLKDHALTGSLSGLRSFSVSGDLRIQYEYISDEVIAFVDIGTHSELYG